MDEQLRIRDYVMWPTAEEPEYGLLLCEDADGAHWTLRADVALVEQVRAAGARDLEHELLREIELERREGWPDEWGEATYVKNASGKYIAMRDDGLVMRAVSSEAELDSDWHLMTEGEYESLIAFTPESELEEEHRRA